MITGGPEIHGRTLHVIQGERAIRRLQGRVRPHKWPGKPARAAQTPSPITSLARARSRITPEQRDLREISITKFRTDISPLSPQVHYSVDWTEDKKKWKEAQSYGKPGL
jgi:hypothetical protein